MSGVNVSLGFGQVINNPSLPHDNFGPQVNLMVWTLSSMALAWLVLRIYCKSLRQRRLWWDDYILTASWVLLMGGCMAISISTQFGFGKHSWDVVPRDFASMLLVSNIADSFLIVGAALSKTSFAITLLRISSNWQKKLVWFIIVSVNSVLGVGLVMTWIRCWPPDTVWRPWTSGYCWPERFNLIYNIFTATYSGFLNIVLVLLPWNILWELGINKKEKVSALAAMSVGVLAGIISFVKIYSIQGSGSIEIIDTVQLVVLEVAEIAVTITAASIPILRALAREKVPRAGPFLALDGTERWTRQSTSDIVTTPPAPPVPPVPPTPPILPTPPIPPILPIPSRPIEENGIELQPGTMKKWHMGKARVQHMPQITESEVEGSMDRGLPKAVWTRI